MISEGADIDAIGVRDPGLVIRYLSHMEKLIRMESENRRAGSDPLRTFKKRLDSYIDGAVNPREV